MSAADSEPRHRHGGMELTRRVADRDLAIPLRVAVGLQISGRRTHVRCRNRLVGSRQHLVPHKDAGEVVVLLELVQDGREVLELRLVPVEIERLDLRGEGVEVDQGVDACVRERVHAAFVVPGRIDVVDADRIGAEVRHLLGVTRALVGVDEGIMLIELVRNA